MKWKSKKIELKDVQYKSEIEFLFEYEGETPITALRGSCGCSTITKAGNKLSVLVKTPDNKMISNKTVHVFVTYQGVINEDSLTMIMHFK